MPNQPEQTIAPQNTAPPPPARVATPPNTVKPIGNGKGVHAVNTVLLVLVILLSAFEIGRLLIPASVYEWGIVQFYRYIVRTNYVVISPYDVSADEVVIQKIVLSKPGFVAIREYSSCGDLEQSTVGHSRYLYAGEFFYVTIPLGEGDENSVLVRSELTPGKKLAVELYEDDGDERIQIERDQRVTNWFGKPISLNITIR